MDLYKAAKEALALKNRVKEMDNSLKSHIINVDYKGIKILANAKTEFIDFEMPEDLLNERKETIETLVLGAFQEASAKAQAVMAEESKKLMGNMKIPGQQ